MIYLRLSRFASSSYVTYGLCLLLGYHLKGIAKWVNKRKKIYVEIWDLLYDKVKTLFFNVYFFSFCYKNVEKMERDLFYKNFDKKIVEKHGKYMNIYDIPLDSLEKIFETKILVIGIGGLGSPVCLYLSKFGFKEIGLVDGDKVEKSNLHRQIIHMEKHIGLNKTLSAKISIKYFDKNVNIKCYPFYLNKENGLKIIKNYDIIIDCCDNISTRFLINDLCILYKKKIIFGSALGLYGQLNVFNLSEQNSNCYRCLKNFNNHTDRNDCDENGILSTVTGVIGLLQSNEVIKLASHSNKNILTNFLTYNSFSSKKPFEMLNINHKNRDCICSCYSSKEIYNFIITNNYNSSTSCDAECIKGNLLSYKYDIDVFNFVNILNKNFHFFNFPIDHMIILDVRKCNNTNVYGLKNSIKWSYYDIMELINSYANNMSKMVPIIYNKLDLAPIDGNIVIIVICRRGIDSLKITKYFNKLFSCEENCAVYPNREKTFTHLLDSSPNAPTADEPVDKHILGKKRIFTYNMKGGYLELQKKVFKNLPFL
ncbi:ubiquitin-activating enzyme, putative [Plasmodium ovale wallikeri]|uniref:Ubiquitin-activating enzyme, putative n=2 Tax=Plasmodium ovale TaxID=36330 RepID=A0A1A8YZ43_PLAOA|nr:ubiquitin-activating enzyme, putative [Plasmodium ovale wallikeri]SBT37520.1 ubiquitin-activating enzyme, putative [Plasmodium ovale wallikeri]SBT77503.1 ubiquitin-activating enzyme, putative [Plasmodium ovale]